MIAVECAIRLATVYFLLQRCPSVDLTNNEQSIDLPETVGPDKGR